MLNSVGIAGKGLLRKESVVELLKFEREKDNLFADFPIGATIQDGGKRKRSVYCVMGHLNTNNFIFLFFYFSDFILIFFSHFFYFSFGQ